MKVGARFYHKQWLDPSKMPAKEPQLFQITKISSGTIYYRPVYDYGERQELGKPLMEVVDQFQSRVLRYV